MTFHIPAFPHIQYGTLYCIGRNYHEHINEMNSRPTEQPVVFLKPRSSIIHQQETIRIPADSQNVHHEAELVLLIGETCHRVPQENALQKIAAFAIGIDLTARDLQSHAKTNGLPWSLSKGFDTFAPVGPFIPYAPLSTQKSTKKTTLHNLLDLPIHLSVNGDTRQQDSTSNMIFPPDELISYLSHRFTLYPGDLIFTGTPKGVSQIHPGDTIHASIGDHLSVLNLDVQPAEPL